LLFLFLPGSEKAFCFCENILWRYVAFALKCVYIHIPARFSRVIRFVHKRNVFFIILIIVLRFLLGRNISPFQDTNK